MLKTLRITSFVCIAAAAIGVLFVLLFGLKKDAQIEVLLKEPSILETLRKTSQGSEQPKDTESPLILESRAFALRINPPPPPPPPPPPTPIEARPIETATDVVASNRAFSGKFDLLGTVQYTEFPEKSLALLELVSEGQKWFRQGETVGRVTIHEIKEGSIVLYSNGKLDSELFVPPPSQMLSLLKSDAQNASALGRSSQYTSGISAENEVLPGRPGSSRTAATSGSAQQTPPAGVPIRRPVSLTEVAAEPQPAPEPEPTQQERKASIDESIAGIQQIMNETRQDISESERTEENQAWVDLLKVLEEEKKTLENADPNNPQPGESKSEP